jgi:dephospho-CoA kinase
MRFHVGEIGRGIFGIIQKAGLKMLIIGVTGSIGTGKTTVARMFRRMGAVVIDADEIAHRVMEPGKPAWKKIVSYFGKKILRRDGYIDRKALGEVVFPDRRKLNKLCGILHPEVYRQMRAAVSRIKRADASAIVVLDVPLLLESNGLWPHGGKHIDKLVVVTASRKVQLERACKKFNLKRSAIIGRIRMQMPLKDKVKAADHVIDNGDGLISTEKQVRAIWKKLAGA